MGRKLVLVLVFSLALFFGCCVPLIGSYKNNASSYDPSKYTKIHDFNGSERFEVNLLDFPQLYASGLAFNCTVVQGISGQRVSDPNDYLLIQGYDRLDVYSTNYYASKTLYRGDDMYEWKQYPGGRVEPECRGSASAYPNLNPSATVVWSCVKLTSLPKGTLETPLNVEFEVCPEEVFFYNR